MKIAILKDHAAWAQALHAEGLKAYAPREFKVTTQLLNDPIDDDVECVYCINLASCNRTMTGGRRTATCVASHAWMWSQYNPADWRTRGVTERRNTKLGRRCANQANAVVCRNRMLERWARSGAQHPNARYIPAGINPKIWNPLGRSSATRARLRVGWSGQLNPGIGGRFKGYDEVWLPLLGVLGDRYEFVSNTRTANEALSWHEMADWYRSLDVFLCTATAEGTPNGPFCAAACGCAIVSTDVGQVTDWTRLRDLDMIVPACKNPDEAKATIAEIVDRLARLESDLYRKEVADQIHASIMSEYSYRVLAPRTLRFVAGVE